MDTMFENLDFRFDKENNDERPFMIACKDREIMDGERGCWYLYRPMKQKDYSSILKNTLQNKED